MSSRVLESDKAGDTGVGSCLTVNGQCEQKILEEVDGRNGDNEIALAGSTVVYLDKENYIILCREGF